MDAGLAWQVSLGDTAVELDWWDQKSSEFLDAHFLGPKELVRVATGFFSASGYALLRHHFDDCRLNIFVGYDERSRQELVHSFLEEFLRELGDWQQDRYATVAAMVEKLQADELHIMDARARRRDHAKVYIIDNRKAIVGSVNLTQSGLRHNFEGATVVTEASQVADWIAKFEWYWSAPDTEDITGRLLERLLEWLQLRSPWEVYLKAASALLAAEEPFQPRESYRLPAEYQMVVVKRGLRQLRTHRGAMIVASTGLGKTVMGTHIAVELKREGRIGNVLVLGPKSVAGEWRERLESGEVAVRVYTSELLDKQVRRGTQGKTRDLVERLKRLDDRWLVIIDESHRFKNRTTGLERERRSFKRLLTAVRESGCHVLLLTATPFATEPENINNQLLLLPHTSAGNGERLDFTPGAHPWRVEAVEQLPELTVATVFNTPYVAKNYAQHDKTRNADYITYPDGSKWYLPKLFLLRVQAPLPLEAELAPLLNARLFQHEYAAIVTRDGVRMKDDTVEERVTTSWASSPWELQRVLEHVVQDDYDVRFHVPVDERHRRLAPILDDLRTMRHEDDPKFMRAYAIVRSELEKGKKIVLYSERYATAGYIEAGLKRLLPDRADRIASAVEKVRGSWQLKDHDHHVAPMIRHFAPQANRNEDKSLPEDRYDIFIATDAYAEGVNLQDGSVLISYDIAWTADTIIQRAGRIMRFWPEAREVQLICFTVDKQANLTVGPVASRPSKRLQRLEDRLEQANMLTEIPILPEDQERYESLRELSKIELEQKELELDLLEAPELSEVSKVLEDYTQLNKNRTTAEALPDDIATAFVNSKVSQPTLLSVIRVADGYVRLRFTPRTGVVEELRDNEFFELLRCDEATERAPIDPARVESARYQALSRWLAQNEGEHGELRASHICSALLLPTEQGGLFEFHA